MVALKTGELARQAGVNLQTIRYYERQGLLPRPARTQAGYRMFATETVGRVRFIKRAQELGFSLREIRGLLALRVDGRTSCAEVRRRAQAKGADVDKKIRALEEIRAALERLTAACSGRGPVGECPILQFLDSGGER
jgi:MerR family mercuric resistance operon transcriptional regulator